MALADVIDVLSNRHAMCALLLAIGRLKADVPLWILVDIILEESDEGKEEALDLIERRSYREMLSRRICRVLH